MARAVVEPKAFMQKLAIDKARSKDAGILKDNFFGFNPLYFGCYLKVYKLTLPPLKGMGFLRNFVLNIPIARVLGRNHAANKGGLLSLLNSHAPQAFGD